MAELAQLKVHPCGFGASPRLLQQLDLLSEALRQEQPVQASQCLQDCLETLLKYFAGCSSGLVKKLETTRPELEALAQHLESTLHYERLLRFSVSVLRGLDHPAQRSVLKVFFENAESQSPEPYPHTRWLQISAPGDGELLNLSAWQAASREQRVNMTVNSSGTDVRAYLPMLNSWLLQASELFGLFYPVLSSPDSSGRRKLVGLEKHDFGFDLLPATSWDARGSAMISLPLPEPQGLALSAAPLRLETRPAGPSLAEPTNMSPWWPLNPQKSERLALDMPSSSPLAPRPGLRRPQTKSAELLQDLERALQTAQSVSLSSQWWEQITQQVLTFVEQEQSGFLLLDGDAGSGRSMLFGGLDRNLKEARNASHSRQLSVIHLSLQGMDWDTQDLVEEVDERLLQLNPSVPVRPLGSRARRQLLEHSREETQAVRLGLYLSQLCHLSCETCLLLLEGLEFQSNLLPTQLPDGVFLLVRNGEDSHQISSPQIRLRLNTASPWYRDEVLRDLFESEIDPKTQTHIDQSSAGRICYLRLLIQCVKARLCDANELPSSDKLHDFLVNVLERRHGERFHRLFWLLATARESVHLFELNLVGADPRLLIELLRDLPSLFQVSNLGVGLGFPAFRQYLEGLFNWRWAKPARTFAEKATLELTESLENQSIDNLQVRSSLDRLCTQYEQLLTWLSEVRNPEHRARILTSETLATLFRQVSQALQDEGRYSRQSAILGRYLAALASLPTDYQEYEVWATLAWGYQELALANRRIGRLQESLAALEEARRSLEILEPSDSRGAPLPFRGEGRGEPWAEIFLLRSEVLLALGDPRRAFEAAEQCQTRHLDVNLSYRASLRRIHCLVALGQTQASFQEMSQVRACVQLSEAPPELLPELGEAMLAVARRGLEEGNVALCWELTEEVRLAYQPDLPQFSEAFLLQALCAALQGQAQKALDNYGEAIRKTSEVAVEGSILGLIQLFRALSGRAKVFLSQGQHRSARSDVERAMEVGARLALWQAGLSPEDRLRLARGFFESLRVRIRGGGSVTEADPKVLLQLVHDARLTLQLLSHCTKAARGEAEMTGQIHFLLHTTFALLQDEKGSQEHLALAIESLAGAQDSMLLAQALFERATLAYRRRDLSQTIRDVCQSLQLLQSGHSPSPSSLLEESHPGPALDSCLELRARAYLDTQDLESSLADLDRLLGSWANVQKGDPREGSWYHLRSQVQRRRGERQAALDDLRRAIDLLADQDDLESMLAEKCRLLLESGQAQLALADFWNCPLDTQLDLGAALAAALEKESAAHLEHGLESVSLQSKAVEVWKHLVQHEAPLLPLAQALGNLGRACLAENRLEEARQHFRQALQMLSGANANEQALQAWLASHLGRVLEPLHHPDEAWKCYSDSITYYHAQPAGGSRAPQRAVRFWRYTLARRTGRLAEALADLDWLLAGEPSAAWLAQKAYLLKDLGRPAEAGESLRLALSGGESEGGAKGATAEQKVAWSIELASLDSQNGHPQVVNSLLVALASFAQSSEQSVHLAQLDSLCQACLPWVAELGPHLRGLADLISRLLEPVESQDQDWRRIPDTLVALALAVQAGDPDLASLLLLLAAVLCDYQRRRHGATARLRLVRVLRNLAVIARDTAPPRLPSRFYTEIGAAVTDMGNWGSAGQPAELDRELTQMARAWQGLGPAWFQQTGIDRAQLMQIRRW